jgi:F-type H+-transporting ATPase subunit b
MLRLMVLQPSFAQDFYQLNNMEETLRQVGELLLGSIPTIIFMLMLWGSYTLLVYRPLSRVLAERRSKTEGAIEKARADIAAADARTAEYEQHLREARAALFKAQEARRQQAMQRRAATLAEARNRAQLEIEKARAVIEQDKIAAQERLQAESGKLAAEIIRVVLQPGTTSIIGGAR